MRRLILATVLLTSCTALSASERGAYDCAAPEVHSQLVDAERQVTYAVDDSTIVGTQPADVEANAQRALDAAMQRLAPVLAECALNAVEAAAAGDPLDNADARPVGPTGSVILRRLAAYRLARSHLVFAPTGGTL